MKTLIDALAAVVRRAPWVVIVVTLAVTAFLGYQNQNFQPAEDQNEAFAPEAPELVAAERIDELFGDESITSPMQVVIKGGDVITADGLAAVQAVTETMVTGSLSEFLVEATPEQPNSVSFLSPVLAAVEAGAPAPTTDEEVKALYRQGLDALPPEQAGFIEQLLPTAVDASEASSPSGLVITFYTGAASNDEFTEYAEASAAAAREIRGIPMPPGVTAEPFSFELLFEGDDEFQAEIGRLFATAAFIILFVLSLVFLMRPRSGRDSVLRAVGIVGMLLALVVLIVPGLALVLPDLFPDSFQDIETGPMLGIAALVYLVIFALWVFLSPRALRRTTANTFLTMLTILVAITWMNGYGGLRFGSASPMAQILPILLIGLGVDYAIHMNSRYQEELASGASVDRGVMTAIRTVGIALVLATITTAVGFLTNVTNEIPALREFGELAAFGIVTSFLLMLTFVPAIRELLDRRGERRETLDRAALQDGGERALPRLIGRAAALPLRAAVAVVIVSIVLAGVGAFGVTRLEAKFSIVDFVPTTSPVRGTFETLLEDFGGGFGETTQILVEGDVATPEAYNAMVQTTANLGDTENVLTFGDMAVVESPVSLVTSLSIPNTPSFDPGVAALAAEAGISEEDPTVDPGADVAALYDAASAARPDLAATVLGDGGSYEAALFTIQTQAGEVGATQLREDLVEDVTPLASAGVDATATSDEIIGDVIINTLRDSQVSSLLITLAAALLLLVVNFWVTSRRPMLGVITTVPVILVVLLSFTLMVVFGIAFGPVTATISALAIGIGIPYMIHITHRYLEDRARHPSDGEAIGKTLVHTGGALAGSALTTIAGFGILVISTTIPFRQFGFVTAYTIGLALLAAVLVLPSYLVLWDRWHRRRGEDPVDREAVEAALRMEVGT
ncbi:MAG TPA: MMPL family transporter [Actinomycetota bacterium]